MRKNNRKGLKTVYTIRVMPCPCATPCIGKCQKNCGYLWWIKKLDKGYTSTPHRRDAMEFATKKEAEKEAFIISMVHTKNGSGIGRFVVSRGRKLRKATDYA